MKRWSIVAYGVVSGFLMGALGDVDAPVWIRAVSFGLVVLLGAFLTDIWEGRRP